MTGTILERIVETKREEIAEAKLQRPLAQLRIDAEQTPRPRDFYSATLGDGRKIRIIAEVKKASPSAGLIRSDFDPVAIARQYESAGASALSVLTDRTYFQGDLSFITAIKAAVTLPVLRKDFIVDAYQVYESRAAGADAVLLIAAILSKGRIDEWSRLAGELGMASLVEVHDEKELDAVRRFIGPDRRALLGINNRDLHVQQTDIQTTHRLARNLQPGTPFVAESGIKTGEDVRSLHRAGASALLIGESLLRAEDPGAKLAELLGTRTI